MILGVIPARKGSAGIPGKNMVDLGGRPLLDHTLATAERCLKLDRIVLSTNMPDAIEWAKRKYRRIEVPFVRPEQLCTASASSNDVILHALDFFEKREKASVEAIVLLQPTCPFRKVQEIEAAIDLFRSNRLSSVVGVSRVWQHPGDCVFRKPGDTEGFRRVLHESTWKRRQDFPEVWFITGALYICRTQYLRQTGNLFDEHSHLFPMAEETMVDIDEPFDLAIARGLIAVGAVDGASTSA